MSMLEKLPKPFLVLAPMDDVTDSVFRQIIASCAKPDFFMTEFVNVDGLQSPGRPRLMHKLLLSKKEHPIFAQVWGLQPENFYKTTKELVDMGYDGVDLNFGCPVKTVIKNGACAALIKNRELAGELIEAVRGAVGNKIPVSVKTRLGFNDVDLSWFEFLLTKKLDLLSVHGRTAKQLSNAPADWGLIGKICQLRDRFSPDTLIVGNGDVESRAEALDLAKQHQLDGVMIGRGIFHDPFLFAKKSPWSEWGKDQRIALYKKHIELFLKTYPKGERKFETLRKFCKVYINGFDGASELRTKFMATATPAEALALLS